MKAVRCSSRLFRFSFAGRRRRFVALVVLCLWLVLSLGSVAQEPKLTPEEWQINGILAALNDDQKLIQKDAVYRLMQYTSEELKANSTNSDLSKILEKKIIELGILDNDRYNDRFELEAFRRVLIELRTEVKILSAMSVPLRSEIIFRFRRILRYALYSEDTKPRITKADRDALMRILAELANQSDELRNALGTEIAIRLNNSSISEYDRSLLSIINSLQVTVDGLSIKEALEKINDTSNDLKNRCTLAKSIASLKKLEIDYIKPIINLINESNTTNLYYSDCSDALMYLRRSQEVVKPFAREIKIFLDSKNTTISQEALKVLVSLDDAASPFVQDIINYVLNTENLTEANILLLRNLGESIVRPYAKNIVSVVQDKSKSLSIRSSAASVLADLNLMQPYTNDIKALISNISSVSRQDFQDYTKNNKSEIITSLKYLNEAGKPFIKEIVGLTKQENVKDLNIRFSAALAVLGMGNLAQPYMKDILNILKDQAISLSDRKVIANSLSMISPLDLIVPITALENIYDDNEYTSSFYNSPNQVNWRWRSFTYFLSGGSEDIKVLLRWIGKSKNIPKFFETREEGRKTLEIFDKVWELSKDLPGVQGDLAPQIARVTKMVSWQTSDTLLLEKHYKNLSEGKYDSADSVKVAINTLEFWQWFNRVRNVIFTHAIFWIALIFVYPNSPQVQAIFFWNPWVRRILGFGYVGFCLTWIPALRDRLLAPFRASLIADAGLQNLPNPQAYFPSSEVIPKNGNDRQPLPAIKGQIILEGESGLGKTMFLRHLVKSSKRNIVYLTAKRCEKGVIEAIQAKLLLGDTVETNFLKDKHFLRNLIYSGAIDVCIDGLNEVTADTRAKITQFVEQNFKGNILLTTQPMIEWNPPGTANIYTLQPLRPDQIKEFLISRPLPKDAQRKGTEYANASGEFLAKFNLGTITYGQPANNLPETERTAVNRILSNPMDLSIVAQMIAIGKNPDLLNLQQQQYDIMAEDYEKKKLREFPLKKFAEIVYQMRLDDLEVIPTDKYAEELTIMEYHKMVVRQWREGNNQKSIDPKAENQKSETPKEQQEYLFRHDKIMEFFIVQTFCGDSDEANTRLTNYISDPRFRGVYFLLATLLPLDAAQNLREQLIQHAADTKDHAVSDTFIQLLRSRTLVNN